MTIWAILPAAGIGRRMGSNTPKQYLPVNGVPVISLSLQKLASIPAINKILVVLHRDDTFWDELGIEQDISVAGVARDEGIERVVGGDERHHSVLNALHHLRDEANDSDWVLVHDAVRPCVTVADIERLLSSLAEHEVGGLLGSPVENTLKQADASNCVITTVDRTHYWNALTPQMFRYGILLSAMEKVVAEKLHITDEASAVESMGFHPQMIEGSKHNIKITLESDLALAGMILTLQDNSL